MRPSILEWGGSNLFSIPALMNIAMLQSAVNTIYGFAFILLLIMQSASVAYTAM